MIVGIVLHDPEWGKLWNDIDLLYISESFTDRFIYVSKIRYMSLCYDFRAV